MRFGAGRGTLRRRWRALQTGLAGRAGSNGNSSGACPGIAIGSCKRLRRPGALKPPPSGRLLIPSAMKGLPLIAGGLLAIAATFKLLLGRVGGKAWDGLDSVVSYSSKLIAGEVTRVVRLTEKLRDTAIGRLAEPAAAAAGTKPAGRPQPAPLP